MKTQKKPRSFGTHDGTFHADEVSACALLLLFNRIDWDKIVRTRSLEVLEGCEYVCDVGGFYDPSRKLFDHHQQEYQGSLSSAGMILEYLKQTGDLDKAGYDYFNHALIMGVDAHDNGRESPRIGLCSFSNVVSNFTPISHEVSPEEQDEAFHEALKFVYGHLDRLWKRYHYMQSCRDAVTDSMRKGVDYLLFDRGLPWLELFFQLGGVDHPALFVIMPSGKHWKLRGIPPSFEERMKVRVPLPFDWAGLLDEELKKKSGIAGAIFCHKGRFISVWETKEDALRALNYTLSHAKSKH